MGRYPGETTQYKWRRTYDPTPDQVHEIDLEIDSADIGTLMAALERRSWLDSQMICPRVLYTLSATQLAAIRALRHRAGAPCRGSARDRGAGRAVGRVEALDGDELTVRPAPTLFDRGEG